MPNMVFYLFTLLTRDLLLWLCLLLLENALFLDDYFIVRLKY